MGLSDFVITLALLGSGCKPSSAYRASIEVVEGEAVGATCPRDGRETGILAFRAASSARRAPGGNKGDPL